MASAAVLTTPVMEPEERKSAIDAFSNDNELLGALDEMEAFVSHRLQEPTSADAGASDSPMKRLKQHVQAQVIAKQGFGAAQHLYEQEGANGLLFSTVPRWISYMTIEGCRYRRITGILDSDDELSHLRENVTVFGYPGASGWADKIGDVAIHYLHDKWAVFSKVYPFAEQSAAISAHEDALLLGSINHVMLTPRCAHTIGHEGLASPSASVKMLDSEGSILPKTLAVADLPSAVRHRLYLTWGHPSSAFAGAVAQWQRPLQELLDEPEPRSTMVKRLFNFFVDARMRVPERWMRYPGAPIDPAYYADLLAKATSMSSAEEEARALTEPVLTNRSAAPVQAAVSSTADVAIDIAGTSDVTA
mmetsp:Transcript_1653/g.4651  ORF Transcript_1653/g.4651 Transcript_1653/m.4651 type:complete len:361 (+) Transcript_1653:159-1241(+)